MAVTSLDGQDTLLSEDLEAAGSDPVSDAGDSPASDALSSQGTDPGAAGSSSEAFGSDPVENVPEASGPVSDQEAFEDVEAAEDEKTENDGGNEDVSEDGFVGSGSAGDPDRDAAVDSESVAGSSCMEGSEEMDSEEASADLDQVSGFDEEDDQAFQPEYYISDGMLYSSDGVALDRDIYVLPASVTASNAVFTPTVWQVNLAEHRAFGDHYLMWAQRVNYSGSSYYWRYYLALGPDITKSGDTYRWQDAEVYSYYTYNSAVTYDVSVNSGSVSGSTYLVYSDLYFDYVGVDPAGSSLVYVTFIMFVIVIALLMIGGKRNV